MHPVQTVLRERSSSVTVAGCDIIRDRKLLMPLRGSSSGVGDTFGTCFGPLSRNRMVGLRLG